MGSTLFDVLDKQDPSIFVPNWATLNKNQKLVNTYRYIYDKNQIYSDYMIQGPK